MHSVSGPSVISIGSCDAAAFWPRCAEAIRGFAERHAIDTRDALVLLPFAQHLAFAEAAWAALPDAPWMPRFETTQTLARRSGPERPTAAGAPSFDALADALEAARQLRQHLPPALVAERTRFEALVRGVVETTHDLTRTRLALPASKRGAWLDTARVALAPTAALGSMERSLASFALAWSATAESASAEALHTSTSSARIALRVGAVDASVRAWMEGTSSVPCLWIDADLQLDAATAWPEAEARHFTLCLDFEDEAQRTTAQVLGHIERGEMPVALVALDRVLLRRVRALLDRQGVAIDDESGWMLSTTRVGAAVVGLLRAVQRDASSDDLLDAWTALPADAGLSPTELDRDLRRRQINAVRRIDMAALDAPLHAAWQRWLAIAEPLQGARHATLAEWLDRLQVALRRSGMEAAMQADAAGLQVLGALRIDQSAAGWPAHLTVTPFDATDFIAFVQQALETIAYRPPRTGGAAQVVITPLARVALRHFAAVVCPGADAAHLGALPSPSLLPEAAALALGVPTASQQVATERLAFAQLLRAPRLALSVRRADGSEPLVPASALLEAAWAAERAGRPFTAAADTRLPCPVTPSPQRRPLPRAPALVPAEVHATAYEAMRACPYRYFALRMLRLAEDEELDDALDARDHGRWLHELLKAFHDARDPTRPERDAGQLAEAAGAALDRLARDDEDFLPFELAFEAFAPQYIDWLHAQEAAGWQVRRHELSLKLAALRMPGTGTTMPAWRGQIDRIDVCSESGAERLRILDYKSKSADSLRPLVRKPFEDTQLAFYAALLSAADGEPQGGLEAAYLAIDTGKPPELVAHADVEASAEALVEGLAEDFARLQDGAALPALGEGRACEHCAARGLCRRDFWTETQE
jgi:ATP-dependent helicase/nuclease subunit B